MDEIYSEKPNFDNKASKTKPAFKKVIDQSQTCKVEKKLPQSSLSFTLSF